MPIRNVPTGINSNFKVDVWFRSYSNSTFSSGSIRIGKAGLYRVHINGSIDREDNAHADIPLRISSTNIVGTGYVFGVLPTPANSDSGDSYQAVVHEGEFFVRAEQDDMYINWAVGFNGAIMRGGVTVMRIGE